MKREKIFPDTEFWDEVMLSWKQIGDPPKTFKRGAAYYVHNPGLSKEWRIPESLLKDLNDPNISVTKCKLCRRVWPDNLYCMSMKNKKKDTHVYCRSCSSFRVGWTKYRLTSPAIHLLYGETHSEMARYIHDFPNCRRRKIHKHYRKKQRVFLEA